MTTAQEASPVIDMTVRPISTMRSTPATIATHSTGICAEANTIAINASEPPGMPGVPMEAMVEAKPAPQAGEIAQEDEDAFPF